MSFSHDFAAPFWFPDSVLLAALLVTDRRRWWLYVLGPLPIRLFLFGDPGLPFWFLLASFVNDSLKALLSAWLLRALSLSPSWFGNLRDYGRYLLIAVFLSPGVSAFAGAAARVYLGHSFWIAWRNWFLGDALAGIILTPLIVVMITAQRKAGIDWVRRSIEALLAVAGLLIAGYVAFQSGLSSASTFLLYLPVPFLLWAAVRFGPAGAPVGLLLISVPGIWGTVAGHGSFLKQSPAESLLSIQLYLSVISIPLMLLSVLITQQRRTDSALRESEQRFRSLVDAGPMMVWLSGPDGLCTFFNKPWLEFTGRSMASELGNGWVEGVHPADREVCMNQYVAAFEARRSFELDYRLLRHDGSYRWVIDRGIPRYDPDATFLGYVGGCIDITDRKEAEDRLRQLSIQIVHAQEAERSRIAQELHDDLSQRIATISMRLHMMFRIGENSRRDEIDEVLHSVIDVGRDISRIARQLHPGTVEKLGLLPTLRALCKQFNSDERIVKLVCERELPTIETDVAVALYRIAQESLRNAVSHGAATQIIIEAIATTTVQLSIKDNGCGFDAASVRLSGLGLSGMAERMKNVGGVLSVVSHPGKGTTVTASVPIAIVSAPGQGSRLTLTLPRTGPVRPVTDLTETPRHHTDRQERLVYSAARGPSKALRILIADDHAVVRAGLRELLSERPELLVVGEAANGVEAISHAQALQPDVILMDVAMPQKSGIEATQEIHDTLPHIKIVGLSSYGDETTERAMREAGAQTYFSKTESTHRLRDYVLSLLDQGKAAAGI